MSTELQKKPRTGALATMGDRYNVEPSKLLDTLRDTVFKGANEAQLMALCIVANEYDLNPFVKEIYAFPAKGGGIVPVISIDGWLRRINSHPQYDGMEHSYTGEGKDMSCTVTIHRKDQQHPTKITEYLTECYRKTDPWDQCPRRMLRHKTIIQCARVAFGFAGHDPDDGEIIHDREVKGREVPAAQVPLLPSRKVEPAPRPTEESFNLNNAVDELLGKVDDFMFPRAKVLLFLQENEIALDIQSLADITEPDAATALDKWDAVKEAVN